jgi:D-aminoacyl-tRNA deacylase
MNIATALTNREQYQKIYDDLWCFDDSLLWIQNEPLLKLDHVDKICRERFDLEHCFDEVIFLSKHRAASGTASLTVHPIGIPWQDNNELSGGIPGRCAPPSRRIACLYRNLLEETKKLGLDSRYQVTQEATHHGPFVEIPTCFVEIGSTEADWPVKEAGEVWADVLIENIKSMKPPTESESTTSSQDLVVITIGGGHYVPRMNDVARYGDNVYTAHALATYTLESHFAEPEIEKVPGGWRAVISEIVDSTRRTYPTESMICVLDKKSFKAQHKNSIIEHLESTGVPWTHSTTDVKSLYSKLNPDTGIRVDLDSQVR